MAFIPRLNSLPFSLLFLFSLLVIAFAADYGNGGIPADTPLAKAPEYEQGSKPNAEYQMPIYAEKPQGDDDKPNYGTVKPDHIYKPKPEEIKEKPYTIAVEGFVYCKTGPKHNAIRGALAKVICQGIDEVGVEKTVLCSAITDENGYFYATFSSINESNLKLKDCKAFLKSSPEKTCNVPTDVNKGITGFPLSGDYRVLHHKRTNLYSARPFFFTSDEAVPNGY